MTCSQHLKIKGLSPVPVSGLTMLVKIHYFSHVCLNCIFDPSVKIMQWLYVFMFGYVNFNGPFKLTMVVMEWKVINGNW